MKKEKLYMVIKAFWKLTGVLLHLLGEVFSILFGALFSSPESREDKSESSNSAGGILNYRTGKFDTGNDPAGWYEED
ncbi:hypothetical protein HBA55_30945 [Pseudomaricurvus alkylphenolicus]|uniref:hypothetical protein n=1 Tax=Pseudomaricurvus alkylphenolicus TaxID=1306991 RepID=UPI001423B67B|nr:hypothetical protein [Pseudomaricurvus alkylphenolicus]NIB44059.1 hypothetical protein [Pseudomaricurvus alkylphenolicus]